MKKLLMAFLMLVGVVTFAGVVSPFVQFTRAEDETGYGYHSEQRPGDINASQNTTNNGDWYPAQLISLSVKGGTDVWLTYKVPNFFGELPVLDGVDMPNQFDMGSTNFRYGYIYKDDFNKDLTMEKGTYNDLIHWSKLDTTDITYTYKLDPAYKRTTTGYLLDTFTSDAEIYLVLTTLSVDGNETVDSYQYVQSDNHGDTTLKSRTYDYEDAAGNIVINFGVDSAKYGETAREFVAVYSTREDGIIDGTTGGPLPGVFFAGLLSLGTVFGASKVKRQKRA